MQTVGSGFDKQTNVDDSDHYQWPWQHKVLLSEPIIDYIEQMRWYCFSIIDHGILCLHSLGLANCDWENSEFSCLPWPANSCLNTSWHWSSFCLRCSPICFVIDAFWWFSCDFWWFFGWDWGTPPYCKKKSQRNHPFVWLWFWFEKVGIRSETHPPRWAKITYFTKKWFWRLPSSASAALSCVKPAPPAALTNRDKDLLLPPVNVKMAILTNKDVYRIV